MSIFEAHLDLEAMQPLLLIEDSDEHRCPMCGSCLIEEGAILRCSFVLCNYEVEKDR